MHLPGTVAALILGISVLGVTGAPAWLSGSLDSAHSVPMPDSSGIHALLDATPAIRAAWVSGTESFAHIGPMPLLAATVPDLPTPLLVGFVVVALTALLILTDLILRIVDRFKPKPPLHLQFASQADLQQTNLRLDRIETRLSTLRAEIDADLKNELRRLYDTIGALRTEFMEQLQAHAEQLQAHGKSVTSTILKLERAIGVLEGQAATRPHKS